MSQVKEQCISEKLFDQITSRRVHTDEMSTSLVIHRTSYKEDVATYIPLNDLRNKPTSLQFIAVYKLQDPESVFS